MLGFPVHYSLGLRLLGFQLLGSCYKQKTFASHGTTPSWELCQIPQVSEDPLIRLAGCDPNHGMCIWRGGKRNPSSVDLHSATFAFTRRLASI